MSFLNATTLIYANGAANKNFSQTKTNEEDKSQRTNRPKPTEATRI